MVPSNNPAYNALSERGQVILKELIERYIRDGQPVGSRSLARTFDLSPASIRNVMADLEELGYLASPHTSAGRVPTEQGYRFFVDTLLTVDPLEDRAETQVRNRLIRPEDTTALLASASATLSDLTNLAGIVSVPRQEHAALRRIEFLGLSGRKVLVILVVNNTEVHNRIIQTDRDYSPAELEQASNFLTERLGGKDLAAIRNQLIAEMRIDRESIDRMMALALDMAERALEPEDMGEDFVLSGQTNLMDVTELADVEHLRKLFDAFQEKQAILHLLDRCIYAQGVQIFIGHESRTSGLDGMSVVTAPYESGGHIVGVLGVIGPTRMAYNRVIPIVDLTARLLGSALNVLH